MKKFAFSLEKVLRLREWSEHQARLALGRAVSEKTAIETELASNAEKRVSAGSEWKNARSTFDFQAYGAYMARLDAEKEKLARQAAAAEIRLEAARNEWTAAKSELSGMENLKKRRFAEYKKESLKQEEAERS
ncbi:MAG: flagellar export protein FliJ [Spirochaetaceae bacterium]|jgi:flagellar export protein FliJ|nr:flagellar export protein FliJ [Spirochaetaceae bacterium]